MECYVDVDIFYFFDDLALGEVEDNLLPFQSIPFFRMREGNAVLYGLLFLILLILNASQIFVLYR